MTDLDKKIELAGRRAVLNCGCGIDAYANSMRIAGWLAGMLLHGGMDHEKLMDAYRTAYDEGIAAARATIVREIRDDVEAECAGRA